MILYDVNAGFQSYSIKLKQLNSEAAGVRLWAMFNSLVWINIRSVYLATFKAGMVVMIIAAAGLLEGWTHFHLLELRPRAPLETQQ